MDIKHCTQALAFMKNINRTDNGDKDHFIPIMRVLVAFLSEPTEHTECIPLSPDVNSLASEKQTRPHSLFSSLKGFLAVCLGQRVINAWLNDLLLSEELPVALHWMDKIVEFMSVETNCKLDQHVISVFGDMLKVAKHHHYNNVPIGSKTFLILKKDLDTLVEGLKIRFVAQCLELFVQNLLYEGHDLSQSVITDALKVFFNIFFKKISSSSEPIHWCLIPLHLKQPLLDVIDSYFSRSAEIDLTVSGQMQQRTFSDKAIETLGEARQIVESHSLTTI
jgi:hypothetical protein